MPLNFELFISTHPELRHLRTMAKTPEGQNGPQECGIGTLKYERLYLDEFDDVLGLLVRAEALKIEYNTVRSHETVVWNWSHEVHRTQPDPTAPVFKQEETLPTI